MNNEPHPLSDTIKLFQYYKKLTERSLSQLDSSQIHTPYKTRNEFQYSSDETYRR